MSDIKKYYTELNLKCSEVLVYSLDQPRHDLVASTHSSIFDYTTCIDVLKGRAEYDILKVAIREFQMALLSVNMGLYNQAFIGLRFFLERTLVAVMFSAKEIDLRLWLRGEMDTTWASLINADTGIFSSPFCRAFFPELWGETKHFERIAQKVYRECSEYVHGNISVQDKIPEKLEFNEHLFKEWHTKAQTIRRLLLFVFCLRYLKFIGKDSLQKTEAILISDFGNLHAVRDIFNK